MTDGILQERIIENKDWATILFVLCLIIIAITKTFFENRFNEFLKLIISDKYNKIYRDGTQIMSWFNISLFVVHIISISFFIQLTLSYLGYTEKANWTSFIQISTLVSVFILSKFLIDKIIATAFGIEEFAEQYNLQKVNYRTYIAILLLPVNIFLFYNNITNIMTYYFIFSIILVSLLLTFVNNLKINKKILSNSLFYFILYLCILEIAPYYFMYYLFTRS